MLRAIPLTLLLAAAAGAAPLPTTTATCLGEGHHLALARLSADGKLSGPPKGHVGPMELAAPPELRFDKVAAAIRRLQRIGGRLSVVTTGPGGERRVVPVSLETDLECVPLPTGGACQGRKRSPIQGALFGIVGRREPAQKKPSPALLLRVTVLEQSVRVQADDRGRPRALTLDELDGVLKQLIEDRGGAVTIYVNATDVTPWQAVVTALAVSHCRLKAAKEEGFDAVLLGTPSG